MIINPKYIPFSFLSPRSAYTVKTTSDRRCFNTQHVQEPWWGYGRHQNFTPNASSWMLISTKPAQNSCLSTLMLTKPDPSEAYMTSLRLNGVVSKMLCCNKCNCMYKVSLKHIESSRNNEREKPQLCTTVYASKSAATARQRKVNQSLPLLIIERNHIYTLHTDSPACHLRT